MTHVNWYELTKEIDDKPNWNKELYKTKTVKDKLGRKKVERVRIGDFAFAVWSVEYNDGLIVSGPKGYADLKRTGVKAISLSIDGKILHTVQVKNDSFYIRFRNLARALGNGDTLFSLSDPKRVFILATKGDVAFVWDDGDVDELDDFGDQSPYRRPRTVMKGEEWLLE